MTTRFWAPQRPTLEPDQVVLALLQPGGDSAGDLGNAMLAMHRAGAAACETVAKGPVPTEHGLVQAIAKLRQNLAQPAVDSVSKAVGDGSYAGLLVRDVFDDAETAALGVFRTCVAKGIAPPLAAQRAGAVFGVPSRELGRYQAAASDPKTNPAMLIDIADRTLLGFVSKLVDEEAGQVKEEVSKAPAPHARAYGDSEQGWDEREHPRDRTSGRFTHAGSGGKPPVMEGRDNTIHLPNIELDEQLGLKEAPGPLARLRSRFGYGGTQAPTVGTTPQQARQAQKPRMAQMAQMAQAPVAPRQPGAGRAPGQLRGRLVSTAPHGDLQGRLRAKLEAAMEPVSMAHEHANQDSKPTYQSVPAPARTSPDHENTPMERVVTDEEFRTLRTPNGEGLTFVMTAQDSMRLRRDMPEVAAEPLPGHDAPRMVRAHALLKMTGQPGPQLLDVDDPSTGGDAHTARYESAMHAAQELDPSGFLAPLHERLGSDEGTPHGREEELLRMRRVLSENVAVDVNGNYRTDLEHEAFRASKVLRDYHDHDSDYVVVPNADAYGDYNLPTIDEFVVSDDVRGYMEGGFRHHQAIIDPNQAFLVRSEPEVFYDARNKVVVNRWTLMPLEEDEVQLYSDPNTAKLFGRGGGSFGKALTDHEAVRFEQKHPRDEEGRFAPVAQRTSTVAPTALPGIRVSPVQEQTAAPARPRQARQAQKPRMATLAQRPAAPAARRTLTGAPTGQLKGQLKGRVQPKSAEVNRLTGILTRSMPKAKDLPILDDRSNYMLMSRGEFDQLLRSIPGGGHGVLPIYGNTLERLRNVSIMDGTQVIGEMNMNLEAEIINNEGEPAKGYVWQRRPMGQGLLRNADDEEAMGHHIRRIFDQNPDVAQIHIDYATKPGYYMLRGNSQPVGDQILLELDEDVDLTRPVELVELGKYRSMDMGHRREDLNGAIVAVVGEDPHPINARMHQFRVQNAKLGRYRVQNADERV